MITKTCPQCSEEIPQQARRHKCGWTSRVNDRKESDPDWWRCTHEDRGQRCPSAGVVSPATHGGAFFCWNHVPAMEQFKDGVRRCPPPEEGFFGAMRAMLKPRFVDFEAKAERIALQNEPPPTP